MAVVQDRAERLLAIILLESMKGASQREKAVRLSLAGFTNVEIANLLQTSAQVVAQHLYSSRKGTKRRRS